MKKDALTMGIVDFGGISREVCMTYVPEAEVGQYALVHVGFAISLLSEAEAKETLTLLNQIADLEDNPEARAK